LVIIGRIDSIIKGIIFTNNYNMFSLKESKQEEMKEIISGSLI